MADCLHPPVSLLSKIGSIIAHLEEAASPGGHPFDLVTFRAGMKDPEVREWIGGMRALALIPLARKMPLDPPTRRQRAKK